MSNSKSESLMSGIPIPKFSDLDGETQLQKVQATMQVRYSHWEESKQKQQKKTKKSNGKTKTRASKSKSKSKDPQKEAEKLFANLSKEQLEKIKKEAGL